MKLKTSWTGDDLAANLRKLSVSTRHDVVIQVLKDAAEPMRATAASLAPRDQGPGPHLADNIVVAETTRVPGTRGRLRDAEEHEHLIAIGPSYRPEDVFWGLFQEFGTARTAAHPFLRPAFDSGDKEVIKAVGQALGHEVLKRLKGSR